MDTMHVFFQEVASDSDYEKEELIQDSIKWKIEEDQTNRKTIKLQVFKKINASNEWNLICTRIENFNENINIYYDIYGIKLFNNNDVLIITSIGIFIYHFNENNNSISLNYFYYLKLFRRKLQYYYKNVFSRPTLPLPNYNSFKFIDKWVLYVKDDRESLLKYGVELLSFAIKEHNLELIDDIYKKCIAHFKENLKNNKMFLSIITSTIPLLNEYYPEYILRYSLETTMITDSPSYDVEYKNNNLHLCSSQYNPITINTKFFLLPKYYFINNLYFLMVFVYFYVFILEKILTPKPTTPTISFMNPYVKFANYPQDYNWIFELIRPQSSPFVKTISGDIYKTWNGEALINFKWNTYGKYYYVVIWISFMALLGCFNAAATIPQQYIDDDVQKQLLTSSIVLGCGYIISGRYLVCINA
ncbi:hypothetical protein C1645_832643 [Glomus cerebriforme]|uniref:Uncharacterized protein n=1 Tax=Glomus cerebriforme TaxID=658196 RepID=A0A397SHS7_9GLOM|nr:hypothetical protein C1645_832643 [Glomus cerebriforme]